MKNGAIIKGMICEVIQTTTRTIRFKQAITNFEFKIKLNDIENIITTRSFNILNLIQDSLILKNGSTIVSTIQSLSPWAVTLLNDSIIAIRTISKIKTSVSSYVMELKSYYPDLLLMKEDLLYTISVGSLTLLSKSKHPDNFNYNYFVVLNVMSARAENLELQINMIPRFCHNIQGQVTASCGTKFDPQAYNLLQLSIGVGYIHFSKNISLSILLNVANKTLNNSNISNVVTFLSLYAQVPILNNKFLVSIGGRYHFSNIPIEGKITKYSLNIGIGYNFKSSDN
jgi:hypothetical protein